MTPALIIGIIGAAATLSAFILNQLGKINAESFLFDVLNLIGSVGLLIYALDGMSWPFIITNVVWGTFSVVGVAQYLLQPKRPQRPSRK